MLSPSYPFYPSFSVITDDLICLQRNTLGSRIHISSCDNEPPIVIDSNASYSVAPLLSNIADVNVIAHSSTVDQFSSTAVVFDYGQDYWRFVASNRGKPHDLLPQNTHIIASARIRLFGSQEYIYQTN